MKKCQKHNLMKDVVCMGQMCPQRTNCQLCIHKHDHKFYLDSKTKQMKVQQIQSQLDQKLVHLKKYIQSNIQSLKLQKYKKNIQQDFDDELMHFQTKIKQDKQNFILWMERIQKSITATMTQLRQQIIKNWTLYYNKSLKYLQAQKEYEQLREFFTNGNWSQQDHVQKSVNFLFSEQVLFKFNKNIDNLKKIIHYDKKQNNYTITWLTQIRERYSQFQLCPQQIFKSLIKNYSQKPALKECNFSHTKQSRDNQQSGLDLKSEKKALLLYPKQIYQPYQNVQKLLRLNNILFATSGSRTLNLWTKTNLTPQKIYQMDYTTYGLSTFVEKGQDDSDVLLFGKSNGQIGMLNMRNDKIKYLKVHEAAVRDIIQFDQYHFVTASQDWLLKIWAINQKTQPKFAAQRATLKGHSGKVHCLCKFGPNLLAAGMDGTVKLWDIQSESFDEVFQHQKQVYSLCEIRPQLFLSGGELNQIRLYDYRIPKAAAIKYGVQFSCNSTLRYNQNSFIYTDRNIVKLIDIRNPRQVSLRYSNKDTYSHAINSMSYLSDMEIGMGGSDGFVTIWKY